MIRLIKTLFQFLFGKKQKETSAKVKHFSELIPITPIVDEVHEIKIEVEPQMIVEDKTIVLKLNEGFPIKEEEVIPSLILSLSDPLPCVETKVNDIEVEEPIILKLGEPIEMNNDKLNIKRGDSKPLETIYYLKNLKDHSLQTCTSINKLAKLTNAHPKTLRTHLQNKYSAANKGTDLDKIIFGQKFIITRERK